MIERLLPQNVASCAAMGDDPAAILLPEEASLVEGAVDARLREFATARWCARRALAALGLGPAPILRGPKREPLWPSGTVGSITHCRGYRAAAVARSAEMLTIGIDAEPHQAVPDGVGNRVLRAEEREWIAQAPAGAHWDRLIFSAKESVYKAWFPLARRWLGFDEAIIDIDPHAHAFRARLLVTPPAGVPAVLDGRYLIEDKLVLTAIAVARL